MTHPKADLIAKYLSGDADADEVQQLYRALSDDPSAAEALLSDAYLDVHLREALTSLSLGVDLADVGQPSAVARRARTPWVAAAVLLVAISGWSVAAYVASELNRARTDIAALNSRIASLETARPLVPVVRGDGPRVHSMRGLLMAARPNAGGELETRLLEVGASAPLEQRLWTCPWGATEFRYDGGASVTVERDSAVQFNEAQGRRQLTLERGIVHVTNLSSADRRPTEIRCALATVRVVRGQVAVQVDEQKTAVEAAVNEAQVHVEENGVERSFTVRRGQYLFISPGKTTNVMEGVLELGLDAPSG